MRLLIIAGITLLASSCHIMMSTPSGIREFGRYQNGLVVTGKSAPNKSDEYHSVQKETDITSLDKLKLQLEMMNNGKQ